MPDGSDDDGLELEGRKLIAAAAAVNALVNKYFDDNSNISDLFYIRKYRIKNLSRIVEKTKERIDSGKVFRPSNLVDVCGFRLITLYQSDIPLVVERLLEALKTTDQKKTPFSVGCAVEIDVNTSRPENDPLSIVDNIRGVVDRSGLNPKFEVISRVTGYSSVHLVARCPTRLKSPEISEIFIEIQIRSVLEDVWGELDHKLRYGSNRGKPGASWRRHLNALKSVLDGCVQYLDVIKQHADEENLTPPVEIKVVKTVDDPEKQLQRLTGLPVAMLDRVTAAFELWRIADKTRKMGGDVGKLRQAADAFGDILNDFPGEPLDRPKLASELKQICLAEEAYMLSYTGDPDDHAKAARNYEQILELNGADVTALFRLGDLTLRQGDLERAKQLLITAITNMKNGGDGRVDASHWVYDAARLRLAKTHWRIFELSATSEEKESALVAASTISKEVLDHPADQTQRFNSVNDHLYYLWELRQFNKDSSPPSDEFSHLCKELGELAAASGREGYQYLDTLMRACRELGMKDEACAAALRVRDILEETVRQKMPMLRLPTNKASHNWTMAVSTYLDADQADTLAHAQDLIQEFGCSA